LSQGKQYRVYTSISRIGYVVLYSPLKKTNEPPSTGFRPVIELPDQRFPNDIPIELEWDLDQVAHAIED